MWQHTQFKSLNISVSWNEHARLSLFKRDIIRQWIKQWYTEELSGCHCCLLRLSWEVWNRWRWITTLLNIPKSDRRQAPLHLTVDGCTKARSNAVVTFSNLSVTLCGQPGFPLQLLGLWNSLSRRNLINMSLACRRWSVLAGGFPTVPGVRQYVCRLKIDW